MGEGALCFAPVHLSVRLFVRVSVRRTFKKVCVINSSQSFQAINLFSHKCYKHIEDVHVNLCRRKNIFGQNYGIMT